MMKMQIKAWVIGFKNQHLLPPEVPIPQDETQMISTNGVSTWSLDAIYMQEVCPPGD